MKGFLSSVTGLMLVTAGLVFPGCGANHSGTAAKSESSQAERLSGGATVGATAALDPKESSESQAATAEALLAGIGCRTPVAHLPTLLREFFQEHEKASFGDLAAERRASDCEQKIARVVISQGEREGRPLPLSVGTSVCEPWLNQSLESKGLESTGNYADHLTRIDSCASKYPVAVSDLAETLQRRWENEFSAFYRERTQHQRDLRQTAGAAGLWIARLLAVRGIYSSAKGLATATRLQQARSVFSRSLLLPAVGAGLTDGSVRVGDAIYQGHQRYIPISPAELMPMKGVFESKLLADAQATNDHINLVNDLAGTGAGFIAALAFTRVTANVIAKGMYVYAADSAAVGAGAAGSVVGSEMAPPIWVTTAVATVLGAVAEYAVSKGAEKANSALLKHRLTRELVEAVKEFESLRKSSKTDEDRANLVRSSQKVVARAIAMELTLHLSLVEKQIEYETEKSANEYGLTPALKRYSAARKEIVTAVAQTLEARGQLSFEGPTEDMTLVRWLTRLPLTATERHRFFPVSNREETRLAQARSDLRMKQWEHDGKFETEVSEYFQNLEVRPSRDVIVFSVFDQLKKENPSTPEGAHELIEKLKRWTGIERKIADDAILDYQAKQGTEPGKPSKAFSAYLEEQLSTLLDHLGNQLAAGKVDADPSQMLLQVAGLLRRTDDSLVISQASDLLNRLRIYRLLLDRVVAI